MESLTAIVVVVDLGRRGLTEQEERRQLEPMREPIM